MKRIFTLTLCLLTVCVGLTQAQIQAVNYRGAFAPAPTPMWTSGWINWDPQNTAYGAVTVNVSSNITTNTTWTANNVYQLTGVIYVDSLITLTIEPGTVIRGATTGASNSSLLIRRGAKLIAEGTPCNPIVFTSGLGVGNRSKGDWGGVIILGRAQNNIPGGVGFIEGLSQNAQNAHGGNDNADNSGVLKYVRIEFGGFQFAPNNEINGLTMGSVGSGTKIDYVQTSFINDDAFEWFGGSVNAAHLVSYQNLDDDFDTDNGYSGKVQFGLVVRDPNTADNPTVSTSEGFESDNDATGSLNSPKTSATFTNMTIIGPFRGNGTATVAAGYQRGARLRRNTELKIFNSIFMDWRTGLFFDGTAANATANLLRFKNNIIAVSNPATHVVAQDAATRAYFFTAANANDSLPTTAGILITPYNFTAPDYRPGANSPALTNFSFTDPALPISLVSFYGETKKNEHTLYWKTSTELNNAGFELQRSFDGVNFSKIAMVSSKALNGNSTQSLEYSYVDKNALYGKSYYRLKQLDKDGRSTLSAVVLLTKATTNLLTVNAVYPNPVRDQLNVSIVSAVKQVVTIKVNDVYGRMVSQKVFNVSEGNNNYSMDVKRLSAGNYFLNVITANLNSENIIQKFIKQ